MITNIKKKNLQCAVYKGYSWSLSEIILLTSISALQYLNSMSIRPDGSCSAVRIRPGTQQGLLVFQGCYTAFCKPGGLRPQKFIPSKFWRLTSLNSRCQQPLSEQPRGDPSLPLLAGNPWGSWLPDCTPPISASVITWPSPCLSSCGLPSVCLSPALFSRLPRTHP